MPRQYWYAMYKGDTYVDQGTIKYLAKKHHVSLTYLYCLTTPTRHKNAKGNHLLLYRMEDDQ